MKRLLVATLLTALAVPAALAAPPTAADLLRHVPGTASAVVAIDSAALRAHPAVQDWLMRQHALTGTDSDVRRFLDDAGLDPLRDVDVMVVAVVPDGDRTAGVALFAGRFDPTALGAALAKRGAQAFSLAGTPAYRLASEHEGGRAAVVALPSAELGDRRRRGRPWPWPSPRRTRRPRSPPARSPPAASTSTPRSGWLPSVPVAAHRRAGAAAERVHGEGAETVRGVVLASGTVRRVVGQATWDDPRSGSPAQPSPTRRRTPSCSATPPRVRWPRPGCISRTRRPSSSTCSAASSVRLDGPVVTAKGAIPVALLEKLAAEHGCAATGERRRP